VTRGISLSIVVGEPYTLYADPCWREYLEYCDEKRGWISLPKEGVDNSINENTGSSENINNRNEINNEGSNGDSNYVRVLASAYLGADCSLLKRNQNSRDLEDAEEVINS